MLPNNNLWATLSGVATVVLVFVCQALVRFFGTGSPWPITSQGWLQIILPAAVAGLLAALTPRLSLTELKQGYRVSGPRDAPIVNTTSEHLRKVSR